MKILALRTGLFPDAGTVEAAVVLAQDGDALTRIDLTRPDMRDEDWDAVLLAILASDVVVTT